MTLTTDEEFAPGGREDDGPMTDTSLPRDYMSVSQINTYIKCGKMYELKYAYGLPVTMGYSAARGGGVHKGAEYLLRGLKGGAAPSLDECHDAVATEFEARLAESEIKESDEEALTRDEEKDMAIAMMTRYYDVPLGKSKDDASTLTIPAIKPVEIERDFTYTVQPPNTDKVHLRVIVDLEEEVAVRDLKTRGKLGNQNEANDSLQLTLYSMATQRPVVSYDMLIAPTKKYGVRFARFQSVRTRADYEHGLNIVGDVASAIRAGVFPRTNPENWWCSERFCDFWGSCRGKK